MEWVNEWVSEWMDGWMNTGEKRGTAGEGKNDDYEEWNKFEERGGELC